MNRILLFSFLLFGAFNAHAQEVHTWHALIVETDGPVSVKPLFVAVFQALPQAELMHDRETQLLTITSAQEFEITWLVDIAAAAGFTLTGLWRDGVDIYAGHAGTPDQQLILGQHPSKALPANSTADGHE